MGLNKEIIDKFEELQSQEDVVFVLGKMRAKLGDVAIDDMLDIYKNFLLKALQSQKEDIGKNLKKEIKKYQCGKHKRLLKLLKNL